MSSFLTAALSDSVLELLHCFLFVIVLGRGNSLIRFTAKLNEITVKSHYYDRARSALNPSITRLIVITRLFN